MDWIGSRLLILFRPIAGKRALAGKKKPPPGMNPKATVFVYRYVCVDGEGTGFKQVPGRERPLRKGNI
jgi:hypothetical protein